MDGPLLGATNKSHSGYHLVFFQFNGVFVFEGMYWQLVGRERQEGEERVELRQNIFFLKKKTF